MNCFRKRSTHFLVLPSRPGAPARLPVRRLRSEKSSGVPFPEQTPDPNLRHGGRRGRPGRRNGRNIGPLQRSQHKFLNYYSRLGNKFLFWPFFSKLSVSLLWMMDHFFDLPFLNSPEPMSASYLLSLILNDFVCWGNDLSLVSGGLLIPCTCLI